VILTLTVLAALPPNRVELTRPVRPYTDASPWNTVIPANPRVHESSAAYMTLLAASGFSGFGANVESYTMPVYMVGNDDPLKTVTLSGAFTLVTDDVSTTRGSKVQSIPIPSGAKAAAGGDGQIILWNEDTGDEWGLWKAFPCIYGDCWNATNGYKYNANWDGIPPSTPNVFFNRGAGVPYLTGLIRPWEIIQGRIEHAVAFAVSGPSDSVICPATKTDGSSTNPFALSEGVRLQLDPAFNVDDPAYNLTRTGKIIARAMQEYGLILIDGSGSPKIYGEYQGTASWSSTPTALNYWNRNVVSTIPFHRFRVLVTDPNTCLPATSP
jgi:hypothetical protein